MLYLLVHKEIHNYNELALEIRAREGFAEIAFAYNQEWKPVTFEDPTAIVRGFLDAGWSTPEVTIIKEWKTGKVYDSHASQRSLYSLVGLLMYPEVDRTEVHTVYLDQPKEKDHVLKVSQKELLAYTWKWGRKINRVQPPQIYPMRPSWKCRFCVYSKKQGGKCPN